MIHMTIHLIERGLLFFCIIIAPIAVNLPLFHQRRRGISIDRIPYIVTRFYAIVQRFL